MRLENKIAIVVGGGQHPRRRFLGNGRATATIFAREGAKVLVVDRDEKSAKETVRLIQEEGGEASAHTADITVEEECKGLVQECVNRYGRIDILHNNVAIGIATGDKDPIVEELDVEAWDHLFRVNLTGMALTCKYALPLMRAQKSGSIINISSGAATAAMPIPGYSCSKAGVHALTLHVAGLGANDGVRCNAIVIGGVNERYVRGTPWDIGYAATFLASDESNFITAHLLPVDGGLTARLTRLCPSGTLPRDF